MAVEASDSAIMLCAGRESYGRGQIDEGITSGTYISKLPRGHETPILTIPRAQHPKSSICCGLYLIDTQLDIVNDRKGHHCMPL